MHAVRRLWLSAFMLMIVGVIPLNSGYAEDGGNLTGDEITTVLSGNSITGKGFTLYYDPSGEVRGIEGGKRDKGKWSAKSDRMCVKWDNWMNGRELCMFLKKDGNLLHRKNTAGTYEDVVELREGNVKGL
jgi:hypothetical protein